MPNELTIQPRLFGLSRSNRDFTNKESWGKNQFKIGLSLFEKM